MSFFMLFLRLSLPLDNLAKGLHNSWIIEGTAFLTDVFVRFIRLSARLLPLVKSIGNRTDSGNDGYILSAYPFGVIFTVIPVVMEPAEIRSDTAENLFCKAGRVCLKKITEKPRARCAMAESIFCFRFSDVVIIHRRHFLQLPD